jgi:hypothetical protein
MVKKEKQTRQERARELFKSGVRPFQWGRNSWSVEGSKGEYQVQRDNDVWTCNCPDGNYRAHQGELCKHVLLVQMFLDEQRDLNAWVFEQAMVKV